MEKWYRADFSAKHNGNEKSHNMTVKEVKIELRVVVMLPDRNAHCTADDIADLVREDIEGIQNGTMRVQMVSIDNAEEVQPEQ